MTNANTESLVVEFKKEVAKMRSERAMLSPSFWPTRLTASVEQARATLVKATADRNNVYAGVRAEQIDSLAAEIVKAKSALDYAQQQLTRFAYLASSNTESQQTLDEAQKDLASARAKVAEAQANYDAAVAGADQRGARDRGRASRGCGYRARRT